MAGNAANLLSRSSTTGAPGARRESRLLKWTLVAAAIVFLSLFLFLPLITVFVQALAHGWRTYVDSISHPDTRAAIELTIVTALVSVPLNVVFGVAAAWCIAKFRFPGRSLLLTLIDLPFAISPVVAGLMLILLLGPRGWLGNWVGQVQWSFPTLHWAGFAAGWPITVEFQNYAGIIFTPAAVILATVFITFPFVARELIPLMQSQGSEEEQAARVLGASGLRMFWLVTLPNIKWGLLYGIILCTARAMGEFGAVAVVSGNIIGENSTMPLHIEQLYNSNAAGASSAAFAVASLLALLSLVTLGVKTWIERRAAREMKNEE